MKGIIFTLALAGGGVIIAPFRPFIALLIYVCFSIIKPNFLWKNLVPEYNYSRYVALALLIGWALRGFGDWRLGRARGVVYALIAFFCYSSLSALAAPDKTLSLAWVEAMAKIVLPCVVGVTLIDSVAKLRQLAWVMMLSQGYLAFEFNLRYRSGITEPTAYGFGGMDEVSVGIAMVTATGLAVFLGLTSQALWKRALCLFLALCMIHFQMFTMTRGGMLGLAVAGAVGFVLIPKRPRDYVLIILLLLVSARLAGKNVREEFGTIFAREDRRDNSAESRIGYWKACLDMMIHHPLTGVGPQHFPLHSHEYGFEPMREAHTLWLTIGAEDGIPALILLLTYYGLCSARLWSLLRARGAPLDPWLITGARMVLTSLAGFVLSAQFVALDLLEQPYYVCLLGAGVLKLADRPESWESVVEVGRA
jgi:O-antigen ligase